MVRGYQWPEPYTGRALRNSFLERWEDREEDLVAAIGTEAPAFQTAMRDGNFDTVMVWAGEAVDVISSVAPAADLVRRIGTEAEAALVAGGRLLGD